MFLKRFGTTSVCHIETFRRGELKRYIGFAEVLVVAVGRKELVKGSWLRKGVIAIDVGINEEKGKIVGDIEFKTAINRARAITPVPGGVGPVTVSMVLENVVTLYRQSYGIKGKSRK